jgi:hypothetical protein
MGRLCIVETLGAGPRAQQRREDVVKQLVDAVDEGRQESRSAAALPSLTPEGVVGGVLSVLHARLISHAGGLPERTRRAGGARQSHRAGPAAVRDSRDSLLELTGPLTAMIVLPYLGPAAASKESSRPLPERRVRAHAVGRDPLRDLEMRLTYRTVRVLLSIAASPGASNREVGLAAGIEDQGQISKLLSRLEKLGLTHNGGGGQARGAPNAWTLTAQGVAVQEMVSRP